MSNSQQNPVIRSLQKKLQADLFSKRERGKIVRIKHFPNQYTPNIFLIEAQEKVSMVPK